MTSGVNGQFPLPIIVLSPSVVTVKNVAFRSVADFLNSANFLHSIQPILFYEILYDKYKKRNNDTKVLYAA